MPKADVLSKQDPNTVECLLEEGDVIDVCRLQDNQLSKKTVRAHTPLHILTLSVRDIRNTIDQHPLDGETVIKNISNETQATEAAAQTVTEEADTTETDATEKSTESLAVDLLADSNCENVTFYCYLFVNF